MSTQISLVLGCTDALSRGRGVIEDLSMEQFRHAVAGRSSIGQHLRHSIEHFQAFREGLKTGAIDYDSRPRNFRLETDIDACREAIDGIHDWLMGFEVPHLATPAVVKMSVAPGVPPQEVPTTLQRELAFLSSHAIHHLAIIDLLLKAAGCPAAREQGVAFSTALHRAEQAE